MYNIDSDLEEGEILDDSPPLHPVKPKQLPRRYVILDSPKHKKNCKYSIRHHAKKLSLLKKTPIRIKGDKFHHKSCSHDKLHKTRSSSPKVFKDYSVVSPHANSKLTKPNKINNETDKSKILKESSFAQMLEKYKSMQSSKNLNTFSSSSKQKRNSLVKNIVKIENECDKITKSTRNSAVTDFPEVIVIDDDDDDDEEQELRRIALATRAKKVVASEQPSENLNREDIHVPKAPSPIHNLNCKDIHVPKSTSPIHSLNCVNKHVTDNYEVVDMDVDEDIAPDTSSSLFVIDTKPSSGFQDDTDPLAKQKTSKCSDDDSDFETDMLRAELINGLFQQNRTVSNGVIESRTDKKFLGASLLKLDKHIPPDNLIAGSKPKLDKPDTAIDQNKPDTAIEQNKPDTAIEQNKPDTAIEQNKPVARFIISLNGESSSEESDEDFHSGNALPDNPLASIEALISGIRQQSGSSESDNNNKKVVPKAVSCLSKAQQEEYNALVKILTAKKRTVHLPQDESEVKNKIIHSPMDDLKLSEKKLMAVKNDHKKLKDQMSGLAKEVSAKKQQYLRSKLNVQSLKEKLVAAEKIRRVKLDTWSKSCKNFESVKKSVSNLELKIKNLQDLCSKVGSSIQGQNYSLPSVTES